MDEERLISLETKMAYLENYADQLQEVVVSQAKEIEMLHKEAKLISEKLKEIINSTEGDIPNRKPPHY